MNGGRTLAVALLAALVTTVAVAQAGPKASSGDVYQKWVEEDVAYIITPPERAEFLRLAGEKDRDRFIVGFWLRRDPTPGTPENEFKEEHYRRIAYSNYHFADARPGWKTDRGRVYIVFGAPQEIRALQAEVLGGPKHPTQVWRYDSGREFRFVDECNCGAYQLVSPLPRFLSPDDYHPELGPS